MSKKEPAAAEEFGPSPYPFAQTIEEMEAEREKQRRAELRRQRKMTQPHHAQNRQGRPDRLAIPPAFAEHLTKQGLMAGWIRKEEWEEYRERGARLASHEEIARVTGSSGALRHDDQRDPAMSPTSAVERASIILVIQPIQWQRDRQKVEQHMANAQMGADPLDSLKAKVRNGHFGGTGARPEALTFDDGDDE